MQVRTPKDIGLLIRETRRQKSMTGAQLARRLGLSHSWLSEIENGKPTAEIGKVLQVMRFLELTIDIAPPSFAPPASERREGVPYPNLDDIIDSGSKP